MWPSWTGQTSRWGLAAVVYGLGQKDIVDTVAALSGELLLCCVMLGKRGGLWEALRCGPGLLLLPAVCHGWLG